MVQMCKDIFKTILKLHSPLLQNYLFSPLTFCFSFLYVYYSTTLSACILTGERRSFWWPTAASCRKARVSVSLYISWRELSEMSTTNQGQRSTTCRYIEPGVFYRVSLLMLACVRVQHSPAVIIDWSKY